MDATCIYIYNIYVKYLNEVYTINIEIAGMLRFSDYFLNLDTWNIVFLFVLLFVFLKLVYSFMASKIEHLFSCITNL